MAGYSLSFGGNVYLIKTDVAGDTTWTKSYGGTGGEVGRCVYQTFDHGYIIAGNTNSFGAGNQDFYLIKTDSNGTLTWSKTYGGENYETATSVQQTNDGGYIVAGPMQTTFDMDSSDVMLLRTDSDGNVLWANTYGGLRGDYAREVEQTADGGFIVSGYSNSYGAGGFDVYLIKTDATGNSGCNQSIMVPMVTTPLTQSSGTATLLPAVGTIEDMPSASSGSGSTVTTVCLATASDEDTGVNVFSIYPNPSHGDFVISLSHAMASGSVDIINILGETVFERTVSHEARIEIILRGISPGMYIVKVSDEVEQYCEKIVIGEN